MLRTIRHDGKTPLIGTLRNACSSRLAEGGGRLAPKSAGYSSARRSNSPAGFLGLGVVAGVFIAGPALAAPPTSQAFTAEQRAQSARLIEVARTAFDQELLDYPSARFRDVRPIFKYPNARGPILCGFVNSRNRMGGYVGWQRFSVILDRVSIDDPVLVHGLCDDGWIIDTKDYSTDLIYQPLASRPSASK